MENEQENKQTTNEEIVKLPDFIKEILQDEKDIQMDEDLKNFIINSYQDIKKDFRQNRNETKFLRNEIKTIKWVLGLMITVFGIFTPLLFSLHSSKIDAKFEAINQKMDAKLEAIVQSTIALFRKSGETENLTSFK